MNDQVTMDKQETESVAWECDCCGKRHLWTWPYGEASRGYCAMQCEGCGALTDTDLERIGLKVWAGVWTNA